MSANGEIIGLVLTGTIDPDTQEDLSWNRFHGKPQLYYNYDLLSVCCSRVYIVCNKFQKRRIFSYYPTLISRSGDHVSALPWIFLKLSLPADIRGILVLSTDFPRISFSDLTRLRRFCDQDHPVVLYNPHENRFEPGIGYYPIPVVRELICCYTVSTFQMQDFLNRSHVVRFMCESITSGEPVLKISSSPTKDQSQIISASASHDPGQCPSAE